MGNATKYADMLGLMMFKQELLTNTAQSLSATLNAYEAKRRDILRDYRPDAAAKEVRKLQDATVAQVKQLEGRIQHEAKKAQPTLGQAPLAADELREIRMLVMPKLMMKNGMADPVLVQLAISQGEKPTLWALYTSPVPVLGPDDKAKVAAALGQPGDPDAAELATGLQSLMDTALRGLLE